MSKSSRALHNVISRLVDNYEDIRYTNRRSEEIFSEIKAISDIYYELDVFNDRQIEAIIYGIMLDLDISKIMFYARPEIDSYTMSNIAFSFYRGCSTKKVKEIFSIKW